MMRHHNLGYVALSLTFMSVGFAQNAALTLGSAAAPAGSSISLPITFVNQAAQVASLQWTLSYSAAVFPVITAVAGPAAVSAGKSVDCAVVTPGQYRCIVSGLNNTPVGDGVVANVTLSVSGSAAATTSPVDIVAFGSSPDGSAVSVSGTGGAVIISTVTVPSALACTPATVMAPGTSTFNVTLSAPAPSSGLVVSLGTGTVQNIAVTLPNSVTVPAGAMQTTFTAQVTSASSNGSVVVTASANGVSRTATLTVTTPAAVAVSVTPSSVSLQPAQKQQFTATVTGTANTAVTWSITPALGTISAAGLYTAPSSISAVQKVSVSAVSSADATKIATATVDLVPAATPEPSGTVTFWPAAVSPATIDDGDPDSVELGVKFFSDVRGVVKGVRFYKAAANGGVHTGTLWAANGTKLASVTFTSETATGWQTALFSTPVQIAPRTNYTISYFAPLGHYSGDQSYFNKQLNSGVLHSVSGANGVYAYGTQSKFPSSSWNASNYWVDVVFAPAETPAAPTLVTATAGTLTSGTAPALVSGDNVNLILKATTTAPYSAEFSATFSNVSALPSALTVGYIGKSSAACTLKTSIFNWMTNAWVQLDSRSLSTSKITVPAVPVPGTLSNYVSSTSGTGDVRIKVGCASTTGTLTLTTDQLALSYAQ